MKRYGLVIGNNKYAVEPLNNAANDAQTIHSILEARGFDSQLIIDATRSQICDAVSSLDQKINKGDLLFFFFAGHAIEHLGYGYIFPIDIDTSSPGAIQYFGYSVEELLQKTQPYNATRIVVLDACRNSVDLNNFDVRPFIESIHEQRASTEATQRDLLVAYSTSYGMKASDGNNKNSLYTEVLAELMPSHNLTAEELFKEVGHRVISGSKLGQRPWFYSSLEAKVKISDLPNFTFIHSFVSPAGGSDFALCGGRDQGALLLLGNNSTIFKLNAAGHSSFGSLAGGVKAAAMSNNGIIVFLSNKNHLIVSSLKVGFDLGRTKLTGLTISSDGQYVVVFGDRSFSVFQLNNDSASCIFSKKNLKHTFYCAEFVTDKEIWLGGSGNCLTIIKLEKPNVEYLVVELQIRGYIYSISKFQNNLVLLTLSSGDVYLSYRNTLITGLAINLGKTVRKPSSRRSSILNRVGEDEMIRQFLFSPKVLDDDVISDISEDLQSNDLMYSSFANNLPVLAIGSTEGLIYLIDTRNWDNFQCIDVGGGRETELTGLKFTADNLLVAVTRDNHVFYYTPVTHNYLASLDYVDSILS